MSWQMAVVAAYLRLSRRRGYATLDSAAARLAAPKDDSTPPVELRRQGRVARTTIAGKVVYVIKPSANRAGAQGVSLIYVHGGAYVGEIQKQHWDLISYLSDRLETTVHVPIYGLAPSHHVGEALDLVQELMRHRTTNGERIYLIGDSAGGALTIAATRCWLDSGGRPPMGLTLIAPWLDIAMMNPEIDRIEPLDPWLSRVGLRVFGRSWAGSVSAYDYRVSPIHAAFEDFPPIDLYVGDRDITVADCRRLRDQLPVGRLRYHEEIGAVHVYPLFPCQRAVPLVDR